MEGVQAGDRMTKMVLRTKYNRCESFALISSEFCVLQEVSSLPPPLPGPRINSGQVSIQVPPTTGLREEGRQCTPSQAQGAGAVEVSSGCLPWGSLRVTDTSTDGQIDRDGELPPGQPRSVQGNLKEVWLE